MTFWSIPSPSTRIDHLTWKTNNRKVWAYAHTQHETNITSLLTRNEGTWLVLHGSWHDGKSMELLCFLESLSKHFQRVKQTKSVISGSMHACMSHTTERIKITKLYIYNTKAFMNWLSHVLRKLARKDI